MRRLNHSNKAAILLSKRVCVCVCFVSAQAILSETREQHEMRNFPGPLTRYLSFCSLSIVPCLKCFISYKKNFFVVFLFSKERFAQSGRHSFCSAEGGGLCEGHDAAREELCCSPVESPNTPLQKQRSGCPQSFIMWTNTFLQAAVRVVPSSVLAMFPTVSASGRIRHCRAADAGFPFR